MVALLMSRDYMRRARLEQFEFPVLVVLSTIGMQVLISANSLIALYLGLELMSLALYVVAAFNRDDVRASEAGLKYFVLGALSSGHDALRRLAALRLCRHGHLPGHCRGSRGRALDRRHLRSRLPHGRARLQNVDRAVPHVDAGRLRRRADAGHRVFRRGAESGGGRGHCARHHHRVSGDHRRNGSRSSSSSRSCRWRSARSPLSGRPTSSG